MQNRVYGDALEIYRIQSSDNSQNNEIFRSELILNNLGKIPNLLSIVEHMFSELFVRHVPASAASIQIAHGGEMSLILVEMLKLEL